MGKLTGDALAYVAKHMIDCSKDDGVWKRWMKVQCDSSEAASTIGPWLKGLWSGKEIELKGKFTYIKFEYVWQRDQAVEQINKEVTAYRTAHPDLIVPDPTPLTEQPASTETPETDAEEKKTSWETYLVVGMAIAAILIVLWPKKKK